MLKGKSSEDESIGSCRKRSKMEETLKTTKKHKKVSKKQVKTQSESAFKEITIESDIQSTIDKNGKVQLEKPVDSAAGKEHISHTNQLDRLKYIKLNQRSKIKISWDQKKSEIFDTIGNNSFRYYESQKFPFPFNFYYFRGEIDH